MDNIIRLKSITIENIKNVENGKIELAKYIEDDGYVSQSNVVGIYGQNGSGKTALVEVMNILKLLLSGESLNKDSYGLISVDKNQANLKFEFYAFFNGILNIIDYSFILEKYIEDNKNRVRILNEELKYNTLPRIKGSQLKTLLNFGGKDEISPVAFRNFFKKDEKNWIELKVLEKVVQANSKSLIFSKELISIFQKDYDSISKIETYNLLIDTIENLKLYSLSNLVVIDNKDSGIINSNKYIPLNYKYIENQDKNRKISSYGKFMLNLEGPNSVMEKNYQLIENIIKQMNMVLSKIIPGLNVALKELGKEFNQNGEKEVSFQLFSRNENKEIPLKYESEGIKKIISILSNLTMVYNDSSYCLVVDELDAGIFEYLLGEILEVVSKFGKGQLIFTSHNLRPLEVLTQEDIVFTTTNRKSNYTKLKDIKASNNMRKVYMRKVMLGVDKGSSLYEETDSYDIRKAFRRAGRDING